MVAFIFQNVILFAFDVLLQFQRKGPDDNGNITEADFTELLLAYAGYPPKKKARMLKRVKKV
jgi:hypothetical protein